MSGNQGDMGACQASPATASAPASQAEPCGLGQSCSPHGADDMSWFLIAVGRKNSRGHCNVVILDYAPGWADFDIEFYWEDTFETDAPDHLAPGAYLWTDFAIGGWGEDEAINASGGTFEPYAASALEARRGETGTGSTAEGSDIATAESRDARDGSSDV